MPTKDWRMGFHIMPANGSLNDPSGLVQFNGTYHVFCQANPKWPTQANKCWDHFTSADLVHWKSREDAITPSSTDDAQGAYPGCATVTRDGLLAVYYTGTVKEPGDHDYVHDGRKSTVIRMLSRDGFTFADREVLLTNADYPDFVTEVVRSPEVWRDGGKLFMLLGARDQEDHGCALIYSSEDDGQSWKYDHAIRTDDPFGYMWENPMRLVLGERDFLSTSVQGLPHTELSNQNAYSDGYFWAGEHIRDLDTLDSATFTEWDQGFDFYAAQSFVDNSGRTIMFAWLGMPGAEYASHPEDATWKGCLSVPRKVTFVPDPDGNDAITQWPVEELDSLHGEAVQLPCGEEDADPVTLPQHRADIVLEGISSPAGSITLDDELAFSWGNYRTRLRFTDDDEVAAGRTKRSGVCDEPVTSLRILVDDSAVEIFVNGGRQTFSTRWFPTADKLSISTNVKSAENSVVYPMADAMAETYER